MIVLAAYDIADDGRREDLALYLSTLGPRVQLSVFECQVDGRTGLEAMEATVRALIDTELDQVRIYAVPSCARGARRIIGARQVEERQDYWIL